MYKEKTYLVLGRMTYDYVMWSWIFVKALPLFRFRLKTDAGVTRACRRVVTGAEVEAGTEPRAEVRARARAGENGSNRSQQKAVI